MCFDIDFALFFELLGASTSKLHLEDNTQKVSSIKNLLLGQHISHIKVSASTKHIFSFQFSRERERERESLIS